MLPNLPLSFPLIEVTGQRGDAQCADIEDIIRSKRAANREKDRSAVDELAAQIAIGANIEREQGEGPGLDAGL